MRHASIVLALVAGLGLVGPTSARAFQTHVPSIDDCVALRRASNPVLSPDGARVAYTLRDTDMVANAYVSQVWVVDADGGAPRQITRDAKSSNGAAWSPDGTRLAFISERSGKRQIWLLDMAGGDAQALTAAEEGVERYDWSRDGTRIAYTATDAQTRVMKDRERKYGDFERVGEDPRFTHLHVIDVATRRDRGVTRGAYSVGAFAWSPDGTRIAFDHQATSELAADSTSDLSVVTLADSTVRPLVTQPGPDGNPIWSPDGRTIAFETALSSPSWYYTNGAIATVPASGGAITTLTGDFDEQPSLVDWNPAGLFFSALHRTAASLYRIDPATRAIARRSAAEDWIGTSFSFSRDGATVACLESDARTYPEVAIAPVATMKTRRLTHLGKALDGWTLGTSQVFAWTSRDGTPIEGVLHLPAGWKPGRRAPLIVMIHGGPTTVSHPARFASTYVYPVEAWLARGALVLEPNYRGSAGYGAAFRALNVRNLGIGDAWDVMSGIDALVARGWVDSTRVGACGWSQGGYISAFLATHESRRFRAISVGAGISDWMTYYVNTDITPFTRQYLKATPWSDPEIYAKTSPITTIRDARTPTLIQHGANDARVPAPDAYELYRGLEDVGVPVRLVVYKGFGHGLNKPRAIRAALEHNLEWFDRWLWGRTTPEASRAGHPDVATDTAAPRPHPSAGRP